MWQARGNYILDKTMNDSQELGVTGRQLTNEDREIALERLARELNWIQQKLDPDEDGDWNTYDEQDKTFFRDCVRGLLVHRETVLQALGISPATIS